MSEAEPPTFRYHPDPVASGSATPSDRPCEVCGHPAGIAYHGPIYGRQVEVLCLRCIADGAAATALAEGGGLAEFTDVGWGVPDDVPLSVLDAVSHRTPGFVGWQQERWMYHCGDAAAYLGRAGHARLREHPEALEMVLHENDEFGWTPDRSREYAEALREDGDAVAYLFRCVHCQRYLAYTDMS